MINKKENKKTALDGVFFFYILKSLLALLRQNTKTIHAGIATMRREVGEFAKPVEPGETETMGVASSHVNVDALHTVFDGHRSELEHLLFSQTPFTQ